MAEIRHNLVTGESVLFATDRARRPDEFVQPPAAPASETPPFVAGCPFCPGNEELDLERLRLPAEGEWLVRGVNNKYPALQASGEPGWQVDGLKYSMAAVGYHEVIVESRLHNTSPALQSAADLEHTLLALRIRGRALRDDPRVAHIVSFKNHGPRAGTSLRHPHLQLAALPLVPYPVRSRIEEARRYFDLQGVCVICRMREAEEREQVRMVVAGASFSAFIPYAAYSPFHLWIFPRRHTANFLDITSEELHDLSRVLHEVLRRLSLGLGDPDYNYVIRSAPELDERPECFHWYVAIVPRVTQRAGFEIGTGMFINTSLPEADAHFLRSVALP